jgi:DNA repair protein RadC
VTQTYSIDPDLTWPIDRGPRRRNHLQDRVLGPGPITLDDGECLQALCGLSEPDADTLLDGFGSLPQVMGAAAPDLVRVAGRQAAARIKLAQVLAVRLLLRPLKERVLLTAGAAVTDYLRAALVGAPREQVRVLFLDKRNRLIADEMMNEGTVDHAPVYPREIVRRALELNASALFLAHNHPAEDPDPSQADVAITGQVVAAAAALGLRVHDHIIVAGQRTVSLRQLGLM